MFLHVKNNSNFENEFSTRMVRNLASYNIQMYTAVPPLDSKGKPQGLLQDLIEGHIEIATRSNIIDDRWKMQSYFFNSIHVHAISRKFKVGILKKVLSTVDLDIFVNISASFIMFFLISKFILKLSWSVSFFEYIRIFTSAMHKRAFERAHYLSERILMCTAILLISYSSAYFVSLFRAVNTSADFVSAINTMDDFINDMKLTIHIYAPLVPQMTAITERNMTQFVDLNACLATMLQENNVICIVGTLVINFYGIRESELIHISKPLINMRTVTFLTRPDWVLLPKFNDFLLRLYEGGLTEKNYQSLKIYWENDHRELKMKISEMYLVFLVVLGGQVVAIFIFALETIKRTNKRIQDKPSNFCTLGQQTYSAPENCYRYR
uniref:Gustatory receptor n=1 Tax=Trichogramma kaykai TaxID=54128 RepID=A0ABD2VST1_9HYME